MMRRLMILALAIAGCSGGGESTTAAESVSDTGSTSSDTTPPDDTGTGETGTTPTTGPTTGATGETGDTDSADTTAGEETAMATTTGACPDVSIVGTWLSEGENVAPLLVNVLNLVSVEAIFDEATFEVNSVDGDGAMGQQLGTYVATPCPGSDTKYSILLEQTSPSAITVEGIFEIDGCMDPAMMRYEVIQTQPDLGAVAPTCDDDFGAGAFGADNIQVFLRQ